MYKKIDTVQEVCERQLGRELSKDESFILGIAYAMGLNYTKPMEEVKNDGLFVIKVYGKGNKEIKGKPMYYKHLEIIDNAPTCIFTTHKKNAMKFNSINSDTYTNTIKILKWHGYDEVVIEESFLSR